MSESIQHECGIALIRLLKPLDYYVEKYGTPLYGFNQLFLLMEKQHNRGQDGAGIGCVKLGVPPGKPYMFRERSIKPNPLARIFGDQLKRYQRKIEKGVIFPEFPNTVKEYFDFGGELLMGHLRYGTSGSYESATCHPFVRQSNWPTRSLMLAGNFTITNEKALNQELINRGQHPIFGTDTKALIEELGFHFDEAHAAIYRRMRDAQVPGAEIPAIISQELDPLRVLRKSADNWDGGFAIAGIIGNGDVFVMRDANGIRPCHYIKNDEVIAFASERVALMTIFNQAQEAVHELTPGHAAVIKNNGEFSLKPFAKARPVTPCAFERIYFSRGNDPEIYRERKALGAALVDAIIEAIDGNFGNSVFSFIPNTAEVAYHGMMDGLRSYRRVEVKAAILEAQKKGVLDESLLDDLIMHNWPQGEKIAHKDIKLRTFITQEKARSQLVSHIYDITYGIVKSDDVLVCVDDSIVRGTTLQQSILKILSRTNPRKIVIASTAPQIRYPDGYGIDMSELGKFIAFRAAVALTRETGNELLLQEVYQSCIAQADKPYGQMENHVRRIYEAFTEAQISAKIGEMVHPRNVDWNGEVSILFLSIEKMRQALPQHNGDWYFSGNYPTPGGYFVLNQAYINFYESIDGRSY